jgi:hypothetical protein
MKLLSFHQPLVQHSSVSPRICLSITTDQASVFSTRPADPEVVRNLIITSNTSPAVLEVFGSSILHLVSFSLVLLPCPLFPESLRDELIASLHFWYCY